MAKYIDADKLCDSLRESHNRLFELYKKAKDNDTATICEAELNTFMECIIRAKTQPTADVVEVKHGYWYNIDSDVGWELVGCSVCRKEYSLCEGEDKTDYCPYCGAKMDGRRDT